MDCRKGTSAAQTRHAPLPLAAVAQAWCSTQCVPGPSASETPSLDEALEAQRRPWSDLPADILGVVVARLALVEDRARLRSVCHAWRAEARLQRRPPPPLPLLVLFVFSGTMTGARRRVPLPEREAAAEAGGDVRCVGSFEGWLVGAERDTSRDIGDLRCFLMDAFSRDVVRLPPPSAAAHPDDARSRSLPIANGVGSDVVMSCVINAAECVMSFRKVVMSSSPQPGTDCVVAAISMIDDTTKLALWQPGMESWCVCHGSCVPKFTDVIFCQGKLYMLSCSELTTDLFTLELSEDDGGGESGGLIISRIDCREVEWPEVTDGYHQNWSMVEWRGKLLIVATYTSDTDDEVRQRIVEVRVFEASLSTDPVRFTEIKSLDGDCVFISPCNSKAFRSCQCDGVEEDRIYFIDGYLPPDKNARPFDKFVYNMKDGTMAPFAAEIPEDRLQAPDVELHVVRDNYDKTWSIVEWRGKLLLVATYSGDAEFRHITVEVGVFEADLSTNPIRFTEIENLDGDCIFISPCSSKTFRSCDYYGVGEDLFYFNDACSDVRILQIKRPTALVPGGDEFRDRNRRRVTVSGGWLARAGEAFDEMSQEKRARTDAGGEDPPGSSWAGLQPDALGVVLSFLPCLADRARVRSVCRQWRAAARGRGVAPPLPLLVLPRFRFAGLTPGGLLAPARRAWMPPDLDADNACCVGSSDAWLVCAGQAGGECFLVHAFSHEVRRLPPLGTSDCSLRKAVLSASPESGPNCIVAGFIIRRSKPELALWRSGMKSWRVCHHALFAGHIDIAFYQGKLYMLWRFTPCLFAFEISEDERGVTISRMKDCMIEKLLLLPSTLGSNHELSCNMVEWSGRLLLIIRYYGGYGYQARHRVKVKVFAMELSTNPFGLTEIHNFDGDCIFVGSGGSKSFPAGQNGGLEGDLIYFGPDHYNPHDAFMYSMKDGRTGSIVKPLPCGTRASERSLGFPVWLFPSE
ncbi:hypothetical protein C2845_PM17G12640 [Panicum miliaceum]|uniref:F-box domain-containing protein n=1 Tax=Panicum miliaceum TaxID=4540 RepID=A0A3L6Q332_PANMI|nr:hypothetical protein C2845_PM17G12640 [Panicum miliaceum]